MTPYWRRCWFTGIVAMTFVSCCAVLIMFLLVTAVEQGRPRCDAKQGRTSTC